ncbi:MAG: glycosyltransferase [Segetibacter sp.]
MVFKSRNIYSFSSNTAEHFFTVIIPARNEEDQIGLCLQTVLNQNYPRHLYEVIVADDFSTDNTAGIVQFLQKQYSNLHLLQLEKVLHRKHLNSYKKSN